MRQFIAFILISICLTAQAEKPPSQAVASATPFATDAGMKILEAGGNAFDAAVAVASVLAVTEPYHSGLGGGGFWLIYDTRRQQRLFIDGRETAPGGARHDMYLDSGGHEIPNASLNGSLSAAIPGEPAALVYLANTYGTMPLTKSLAPAIEYAKRGFPVTAFYQFAVRKRLDILRKSPAAAKIFLRGNEVPTLGTMILQPDLATVLERIATDGRAGFYQGATAESLIKGVQAHGGIWTLQDLLDYRLVFRKPLIGQYGDMTIWTAPPPSAGGVSILTMLNILSNFNLSKLNPMTSIQVTIEAMRRAFWDRASYLCDPAFVDIPLKRLISESYGNDLARSIHLNKATPSDSLPTQNIQIKSGTHTTHYSILDRDGNLVSATLSLNYLFGSGFVPSGTGVLLNDHMDDFSVKINAENIYGLVGSEANKIAPHKRPVSSMAPTFIETHDRIGILGVPGGSRIPTMILLGILDFAKGNLPGSWVSTKRFHHQYLPDVVEFEPDGLDDLQQQRLKQMGYNLKPVDYAYGNMQAILWDKKTDRVYAASDPRYSGKAVVE